MTAQALNRERKRDREGLIAASCSDGAVRINTQFQTPEVGKQRARKTNERNPANVHLHLFKLYIVETKQASITH